MDLLAALDDEALFAPHFRGASWRPWRGLLACLAGEASELPPDLASLCAACTGREDMASCGPFSEAFVIAGRRSGKSRIASLVAVWTAVSRNWRALTAPGELAVVAIIAADRAQSRVVFRYARALIRSTPMLASMIVNETAQRLELSNGSAIEVFVASSVSVRGYSIACAVLDEIAYWPSEGSADPDTEVLAALRPALATLPGSMLIAISSPYARRGVLYQAFAENHGRIGAPKLVWQASTRTMNATVSAETVAAALEEDPQRAAAEWLGEFRSDAERLVSAEVISSATVLGRHELPPCAGTKYFGFLDPSGGSSDSFTLAIAHSEASSDSTSFTGNSRAILDLVREYKPPFSPEVVCRELSTSLKAYGLFRATADKYAGVWVTEAFAKHGITVRQCAEPKSQLYSNLLPALNSGKVELLDHPRLIGQLAGLERRVSRSGRDAIDHPPNSHDDVINSASGALTLAMAKSPSKIDLDAIVYGPPSTASEMFLYQPESVEWDVGENDGHRWRDPSYE